MANLKFRMDVPLVPQARNSSCWYASACMVSYYREAGPRLGLPKVWQENNGISLAEESALARNEGLVAWPLPKSKKFSEADVYAALKQAGPLWTGGDLGRRRHACGGADRHRGRQDLLQRSLAGG